MTVHLPDTAEIECDNCGETDTIDLASYPASHNGAEMVGYDFEANQGELPEGWEVDGEEHFCPECT